MKRTSIALIVIGAIAILGGLYAWTTYNSLVTLNEAADSQWKQVETQYQRRFDLIPNLVNSVKGVMKQEQAVFDAIAQARTQYSGAVTVDQKAAAASQVESSLGRLLAVVENYPTLQSSANVQTLMSQLEGTENRISVERMRFNDAIQAYNLKAKRFPSSLVASWSGFAPREYFNAAPGTEAAPSVNL